MRRNNFTSASDRRWQRRYERIQQRREEELERRNRQGRDDAYELIYDHDMGIDQLAAYAQCAAMAAPILDAPNMSDTVIPSEVWTAAADDYQRRAVEARRNLEEEILAAMRAFRDAAMGVCEAARVGEELHERTAQDIEQHRGYRAQTMVVDDGFAGTLRFKNGGYLIIDDLVPACEPEPELKAGDSTELDSFLGNFLAPGA